MTDDNEDDVYDEPVEAPVKPKKSIPRPRGIVVAWVVATVAIVWGVYEYRRAGHLAEQLSAAQAENATLTGRVSEIEQLMNETAAKLDQITKLRMPVSVVFRRASTGPGLNAFFRNNAPEPITVSVLLTNPVTNRRRESNMAIPANGVQEIGEAQGWIFAPGQRILMTHAQFGSVEYVVPAQ
jgi:hypothetical protein